MNFLEISQMQMELDQRIFDLHQESGFSTYRKRILALMVELGELANETRCFKFWSNKPANEKHTILDEYMDVIHFLVSLGLDLEVDFARLEYRRSEKTPALTECFLAAYSAMAVFEKAYDQESYDTLAHACFDLGYALCFRAEDISEGYAKKNAVNHQRQSTNY